MNARPAMRVRKRERSAVADGVKFESDLDAEERPASRLRAVASKAPEDQVEDSVSADEAVVNRSEEEAAMEEEESDGEADGEADGAHSSEVGVVEEVHMVNFMCHRNLTVTFGPHFNVVTGANGSGKSAILAALQVCLGGSTAATGRASKMSEMVTRGSGASYALVRVKLRNQGEDAHDAATYGKSIYIERKIMAKTGGSWRVLDDRLKMKSNKKKEVTTICDKFNLTPANPIVVLTQTEAKNFLQSNASAKYKFFLSATDLDKIEATHSMAQSELALAKSDMAEKQKRLPLLKQKQKDASAAWDNAREVEGLAEMLRLAKCKMGWRRMKDHEENELALQEDVEHLEAVLERGKAKMSGYQAKLDGSNAMLAETRDQQRAFMKDIREINAEKSAQLAESKRAEKGIRAAEKGAEKARAALAELQADITRQRGEIDAAKRAAGRDKRARAKQARSAAEGPEQRAARVATEETDAAKAKLAAAKRAKEELEEALAQAKQAYADADAEVEDAREASENGRSVRREIENDLFDADAEIQAAKAPAAAAAGPVEDPRLRKCSRSAQRLWRQVRLPANASKFQTLPKGPIAVHIKMKPGSEQWARAAERAIGAKLCNTFIVDNLADYTALKRLIPRGGQGNVPVIRTKFIGALLPMPPGKLPGRGLTSIFDTLVSDDVDVMNLLIDQKSIERKIVVTQANASGVMFAPRGAPPNVTEALDERATIYKKFGASRSKDTYLGAAVDPQFLSLEKERSAGGRGGGGSASAASPQRHRARDIAQIEADVRALKAKLTKHDAQKKRHDSAVLAAKKAAERRRKERSAAMVAMAKCEDKVQALEHALDAKRARLEQKQRAVQRARMASGDARDDEADIEEELAQTIADIEAEIKEAQEREGAAELAITTARDEVQAARDAYEPLKGAADDFKAKVEELHDRQVELRERMLQIQEKIDKINAKIKSRADKDAESAVTLGEKKTELKEFTEKTAEYTARITDKFGARPAVLDQSLADYENEAKRILARIEVEKERRGVSDVGEARADYERSTAELESVERRLASLKVERKKMRASLKARQSKWKSQREEVGKQVATKFTHKMGETDKAGDVHFDHKRKELNVKTLMNAQATQGDADAGDLVGVCTDSKEMSGGERSFTTLTLLLAIGECVETPFRVMDEPDVCMDAHSRDTSIQLLLKTCVDARNRQFILITPQDVSMVRRHADFIDDLPDDFIRFQVVQKRDDM